VTDETQALLKENRRLRRDVRLLRERVDAFERSRWWRLHPRMLVRLARGDTPRDDLANEPGSAAPAPADHEVAQRFREEVVARGSFRDDVFTHEISHLDVLLEPLTGRASSILEIGSYEGMSCCFFLWRLREARITCIDTFAETVGDERSSEIEARFDANVALVDAVRVRKLVDDSRRVLVDLLDETSLYDLVYVDGSHYGLDVLVDGALSWRLLPIGGTLVFDDYAWNDNGDDALLRPGPAIDAVLGLVEGKYELLFKGAQLAIRKSA
jgi:predicted O-methyltransferase YrrM